MHCVNQHCLISVHFVCEYFYVKFLLLFPTLVCFVHMCCVCVSQALITHNHGVYSVQYT